MVRSCHTLVLSDFRSVPRSFLNVHIKEFARDSMTWISPSVQRKRPFRAVECVLSNDGFDETRCTEHLFEHQRANSAAENHDRQSYECQGE